MISFCCRTVAKEEQDSAPVRQQNEITVHQAALHDGPAKQYALDPKINTGEVNKFQVRGQEMEVGNHWVVPHNKVLSRVFSANEYIASCNSIKGIRYKARLHLSISCLHGRVCSIRDSRNLSFFLAPSLRNTFRGPNKCSVNYSDRFRA